MPSNAELLLVDDCSGARDRRHRLCQGVFNSSIDTDNRVANEACPNEGAFTHQWSMGTYYSTAKRTYSIHVAPGVAASAFPSKHMLTSQSVDTAQLVRYIAKVV